MPVYPELPLSIPKTRREIEDLQRVRKVAAVENARRSPFWKDRLAHIDTSKLDDPAEWRKIPILDKDQLRTMSTEEFYNDFCLARPGELCEYWRSGGSTGRALHYPKTYDDIRYNMVGFTRTFGCAGISAGESAQNSYPLGVHPVGHMWARAAQIENIGVVWTGAGNALPSSAQLELLKSLKPTIWMGMSSYGLHLANLAEAEGVDLRELPVRYVLCSAEALSASKRAKMEREWGATVFDNFGMTEISMMGAEGPARDGFHIWTDLALVEVLDPETWEPVPEGQPGRLVSTSLFSHNGAPFLRWDSGDIVIYKDEGDSDTPYSVFPVIRHAHRTAGFFKVRGVNVNHQEFEDFMFDDPQVNDFKVELKSHQSGLDVFDLSMELKRGADAEKVIAELAARVKRTFEVSPEINVLSTGTLGGEFAASVKAQRFIDNRD